MTLDAYLMILVARKLIAQGWTQHAFARDVDGNEVSAFARRAVRWSLTGALDVATAKFPAKSIEARIAVHTALDILGAGRGDDWNNRPDTARADVLYLLEAAMNTRISAAGGEVLQTSP